MYIRISSFSNPKLEKAAVQAVQKSGHSKAIIIDVRGNSGGTSPETLVGKLMNRGYRWWSQSTPIGMGLLKYQGILGEHPDALS